MGVVVYTRIFILITAPSHSTRAPLVDRVLLGRDNAIQPFHHQPRPARSAEGPVSGQLEHSSLKPSADVSLIGVSGVCHSSDPSRERRLVIFSIDFVLAISGDATPRSSKHATDDSIRTEFLK